MSEWVTYRRFKPCLVAVESIDSEGIVHIGTAFHIGDGYLVTARHVVQDFTVNRLISELHEREIVAHEYFYPDDENIDLAVIRTNLDLNNYITKTRIIVSGVEEEKVDHIPIGGHLDDWIDDGLVLMQVVVFGYPPIPTSPSPVLVAVRGEVNAVIDPYIGSPHPLFVISPTSRGGFSGGPVITRGGWLLGVTTTSLVNDHAVPELGFAAALTIEPLLNLLFKNRIFPAANAELMYMLRHGWGLDDSDFPFAPETINAWKSRLEEQGLE